MHDNTTTSASTDDRTCIESQPAADSLLVAAATTHGLGSEGDVRVDFFVGEARRARPHRVLHRDQRQRVLVHFGDAAVAPQLSLAFFALSRTAGLPQRHVRMRRAERAQVVASRKGAQKALSRVLRPRFLVEFRLLLRALLLRRVRALQPLHTVLLFDAHSIDAPLLLHLRTADLRTMLLTTPPQFCGVAIMGW